MLPEVARAASEATAALLPMYTTGTREPARSPQPGKTDSRKANDLGKSPGQDGCAPPGTRTPNPRIKSPLLCSFILFELLLSYADACRELPFCPAAGIRGALRMPDAAGACRGIRANMEQTSACTGLDHHSRGHPGVGRLGVQRPLAMV